MDMALILVTDHAAKRFKQRKGIDVLKPRKEVGPLVAVAAMKTELFKNKPSKVVIDGDTYVLSYSTSVEGEQVCTIHTIMTSDMKSYAYASLKRRIKRWVNDW